MVTLVAVNGSKLVEADFETAKLAERAALSLYGGNKPDYITISERGIEISNRGDNLRKIAKYKEPLRELVRELKARKKNIELRSADVEDDQLIFIGPQSQDTSVSIVRYNADINDLMTQDNFAGKTFLQVTREIAEKYQIENPYDFFDTIGPLFFVDYTDSRYTFLDILDYLA